MSSAFWQAEARFDWQTFVNERGGMRALRGKAEEYLLTCPDCGKLKLAVNVIKRKWQCWTCAEAGHDAASLVAKVDSLMFKDALVTVLSGFRAPIGRIDKLETLLTEPAPTSRTAKPLPWPDGFRWLSQPMAAGQPATPEDFRDAFAYCQHRGIPHYAIQEMRIGLCRGGRFDYRLIFPVFDRGGRLIFYQGRAMWDPVPGRHYIKTLSPTNTDGCAGASGCLLNLSYLIERGVPESLLIVEGPVDCAHAWPDAVATFGKSISPRQIELLVRAGVKAIDLCWDFEALRQMETIAPGLADLFDVRIVHLPPGQDPGDLTKEQIEHYRQHAVRWGSGDRLSHLPFNIT